MRTRSLWVATVTAALLVSCASTPNGGGAAHDPTAGDPKGSVADSSTLGSGARMPARPTRTTVPPARDAPYLVFNTRAGGFDAHEPDPPYESQEVIIGSPDEPGGPDLSGQICFLPDGTNRFVTGKGSQKTSTGPPGWGIFQVSGTNVGDLAAEQFDILRLSEQHAGGGAAAHGCGFLDDQRLLTSYGGSEESEADGQLILWFPPRSFGEAHTHCVVDVDIASPRSIWVDGNDDVYVAAAGSSDEPGASGAGVWRYSPPFPTGDDAQGGCARRDASGAPMADTVTKTRVIAPGPNGPIAPSGLAGAPNGNLYVSSGVGGTIDEYGKDGQLVRTILKAPTDPTPDGQPPRTQPLRPQSPPPLSPLGIGVGPDGSIFFVSATTGAVATGTTRSTRAARLDKIGFTNGQPEAPETITDEVSSSDGIGIFVPSTANVGR